MFLSGSDASYKQTEDHRQTAATASKGQRFSAATKGRKSGEERRGDKEINENRNEQTVHNMHHDHEESHGCVNCTGSAQRREIPSLQDGKLAEMVD